MFRVALVIVLKIIILVYGLLIPRILLADRSASAIYAAGELNVWFAMQLPLFIEWPNLPAKSSSTLPAAQPVVNFCLDISDPQRHVFNKEKEMNKIGYEFNIKLIENTTQLDQCHILIIHRSQEYRLSSLLLAIKNKPILTVSDINNFSEKGGIVALFFSEKRLSYIFNLREAKASGLKISSRVLELADAVYD